MTHPTTDGLSICPVLLSANLRLLFSRNVLILPHLLSCVPITQFIALVEKCLSVFSKEEAAVIFKKNSLLLCRNPSLRHPISHLHYAVQ